MEKLTTMQNLREKMISENAMQFNDTVKNVTEKIQNNEIDWYIKQFLTDLRINQLKNNEISIDKAISIAMKKIEKKYSNDIDKTLEKIDEIENAIDLNNFNAENITITVEWKKSQTWGNCPVATLTDSKNRYFGEKISGCGYDKESAAIASVLNQYKPILKLIYQIKNDNIDISNHELFGYGSGYGTLPYFEGGVGVSCFYRIFEKIGYKMTKISSGYAFDVYTISKLQ